MYIFGLGKKRQGYIAFAFIANINGKLHAAIIQLLQYVSYIVHERQYLTIC